MALLVSISKSFSQSTSWKGTVSINWNNAANWTNGIPDNTKDVILGDANFTGLFQPKVNIVSTCKSITIGGTVATTLTMTRGLTASGNITINANGALIHQGATLYAAGNFTNNGAYSTTATSSRIIFNGTNQTVGGSTATAFRVVVINASSTILLNNNISVTGASASLGVYGILDPGQSPSYTVTSTGLTRVYDQGKIKVNTADFTSNYVLTGTTTLYSGSIVDYSSTTVNQTISSSYSYSTLMISGTGVKSLAANLPAMYAKNITNGRILVTSATLDLGTYTANRGTTVVGGELNVYNGATLKIGGTSNFPANFATRTFGSSSLVEYNGTDQTISGQAYGNLLFSTAGIKTATTAFSTSGNFTITNGTFNMNATAVTHSIAGNFTMTGGSITGTAYNITMNGTASQTITVPVTLYKLTINNTGADVNLAADITVSNTLTFTKGNIKTGNYNVIIPATATVSGAAQNTGWVNGNLQKNVTTGSSIYRTFEVGETSYAPVMILFANVAIAGDLTVIAKSTDHSEINYSGLDPAKDVNLNWSFDNSGILFTTASATFNWDASDLDAGATTASFKAGSFNGTSWTMPTVNSPLATSIQVTGITSLGDFSIGERIGKSTWTGDAMTSDWFTAKNWLGLVPSTTDPTLIPNGITGGRVYPIINTGTAIVSDLTVEASATLTVSAATLKIAGTLTSISNVTASDGTIEFNGSSAQSIAPGSFVNNTIKNLVVSNDLSMPDVNIITGTLSVSTGKTLTSNDNLVLRSDANGTASIATLPTDGSGNATAYITGNVSIERYIPARKAWRLLSAPIQSASTATIEQSWQEAAYSAPSFGPNPDPHPGYGVHICGGSQANGFDQSPTNTATLKVFNSATNNFTGISAATGTFIPIKSYPGYMIYIRGDRGIDLSQGNNAAITSTTLRMKGAINTGNQASSVNATGFTVLGNPYPSPIDFATITRSNVKNSFYMWDPKLSGSNGLGGYVTVSWNSGTNSYDVTTSASPVSQYIPSGEAVLIESQDGVNPGTVTIKETDKTTNGSDAMFGRGGRGEKLRINLYAIDADGTNSLLDGTLSTYSSKASNQVDKDDVKKLFTDGETIALSREGNILAIERRKTIEENETSYIHLANLAQKSYQLEIIAEHLDKPGFTAYLKDNFSSSVNNAPVKLNGTTAITFSVTDNPASSSTNRFSIVFVKENAANSFAFKSVKANLQQKNIAVDWFTENEQTIGNYEIEGSADGVKFTKLSSLVSKSSAAGTYSWFDLNAAAGDHYYRIKSVAKNGDKSYSSIVKVTVGSQSQALAEAKGLTVYPNPVKNNSVSIQLAYLERGMYIIEITNMNGQMVKRVSLMHNGGTIKYTFPIDNNLPSGKYQLKLTDGAAINYVTSMIKE